MSEPGTSRTAISARAGADYMDLSFTLGSAIGASFNGGAYNDTLVLRAGNDTLVGDGGSDILCGGEGSDLLFGEDMPTRASAIPIAQRTTGMIVSAVAGNDVLFGGATFVARVGTLSSFAAMANDMVPGTLSADDNLSRQRERLAVEHGRRYDSDL